MYVYNVYYIHEVILDVASGGKRLDVKLHTTTL